MHYQSPEMSDNMHPENAVSSIADLDCSDISSACRANLQRQNATATPRQLDDDALSSMMMTMFPPDLPRIPDIGDELDDLRCRVIMTRNMNPHAGAANDGTITRIFPRRRSFPPKLRFILNLMEGNSLCVDCVLRKRESSSSSSAASSSSSLFREGGVSGGRWGGSRESSSSRNSRSQQQQAAPTWALVKYGALICGQCAFHHMTLLGEDMQSSVLSLENGYWTLHDVLSMLEGGNKRLMNCFNERSDRKTYNSTSSRSIMTASGKGNSDETPDRVLKRSTSSSTLNKSRRKLFRRFTSRNLASSSRSLATLSVSSRNSKEFSMLEDHYQSKTATLYRKALADRVEDVVAMQHCSYHRYHPQHHNHRQQPVVETVKESGTHMLRPQKSNSSLSGPSSTSSRSLSSTKPQRRLISTSKSRRPLSHVLKRDDTTSEGNRSKTHASLNQERSIRKIPLARVPPQSESEDRPLSHRNFDPNSTLPAQYNTARSLEVMRGSSQQISAITLDSFSTRSLNSGSSRRLIRQNSRNMPIVDQNETQNFKNSRHLPNEQRGNDGLKTASVTPAMNKSSSSPDDSCGMGPNDDHMTPSNSSGVKKKYKKSLKSFLPCR